MSVLQAVLIGEILMNENPRRGREEPLQGGDVRTPQGAPRNAPKVSGNPEKFRLNLSDEDIATGMLNVPQRKKQPAMDTVSYKKVYYTEKERKQEEKEHKKRNKLKAGKNKRIFSFVWIIMVALVSLTLATYLIGGANDVLAVGRAEGTVELTIPENLTNDELTDLLYENNLIKKPEFFKLYLGFTSDAKYAVPGTYKFEADMDYEYIINTLEAGNDVKEEVEVTFPEGLNALDIAKLLEENEVCTAEEALAAMNDESLYTDYPFITELPDKEERYYLIEGYIFPDTYKFYKGDEPKAVLTKMLDNFKIRMAEVETLMANSSYSQDQIINIASIIQREAANNEDMAKVSAVLHNRLEWGAEMYIYTLGCDSTIFYPYKTQADVPEEMVGYTSRYNTYEIEGLPAGAICNPGLSAIRAALTPDPEGSDWLYFCHDADGNAYYATNEYDHNINLGLAGLL